MSELDERRPRVVGRRHVLRRSVPEAAKDVEQYALSRGFRRSAEIRPDRTQGIPWELVWRSPESPGAIHYVQDLSEPVGVVLVAGPDPEPVAELSLDLVRELDCLTDDQLLTAATVPDAGKRMHAIRRLGLGAPDHFDQGYFDAIAGAHQDADDWVRHAAVWATMHSAYREFVGPLQQTATNDPDPRVRTEATTVLAAFAKVTEERGPA